MTEVSLQPTAEPERIDSMDTIRGVALLGILLMNITGFGLSGAYFDPTINGGSTGWNLTVWWASSMFFEGTMRGLFSLLFGAGVILFTTRTRAVEGISVTDAYFRRVLWLFFFGVVHAYILLWDGEILYAYGLVGMFVFSFRHWKPAYLVIGAIVLLSASTGLSVKEYYHAKAMHDKAITAREKKTAGHALTKEDTKAIEKWDEEVAQKKPKQDKIDEDIAARQKDYFSVLLYKAPTNQTMETYVMYRYFFWDAFAMMLMGMAFIKNGILKATKSYGYYAIMVVGGYAVGLTVNYFETTHLVASQWGVLEKYLTDTTYDLGRVFTTLGHIGLIMLFIKSRAIPFLQKALSAVGQMAFTNYILHTLICNTIFLGIGFGLYGKLQRYELYYIVLGIWIFQLIASPLWMRYFRFGPLEWMWRSLTYWQRQPFRRESLQSVPAVEAVAGKL